jgi:hypothetical protein
MESRAATLAELLAFEATSLPNGMTRFAAPKGGHDDLRCHGEPCRLPQLHVVAAACAGGGLLSCWRGTRQS